MDAQDHLDDADWSMSQGLDEVKEAFTLDPTMKDECITTLEQWVRIFNREIAYMQGLRGPTRGA